MSNQLLSVCIPAYKRPLGLKKAIKSVINQNNWDQYVYEILIIDDCPSESVFKVAKKYLEKYPKVIRYIQNSKNIGLDLNFIKLMKKARGKYILFLTDDDELLPDSLQNIYLSIEKNNSDAINGPRKIYIDGKYARTEIIKKEGVYASDRLSDLVDLIHDSNILSGLCIKRQSIIFHEYKKHIGSLFAHLYVLMLTVRSGNFYYLKNPIVKHLVANKVYWNYDDCYNLGQMKNIGIDIKKYDKKLGDEFIKRIYMSIPYVIYINLFRWKKLFHTVYSLLENDLINIKSIPFILWGSIQTISKKIKYS